MLNNDDYRYLIHEIKNSVSIIGSSLQLIEKQHPEVKEYHFWNDTQADIEHLRSLIADTLTLQVHEHIAKTDVNLYDFLEQLYATTRPLFDEDATILFDTENNLPLGYFDPLQIHHALLNIIKNASEAMNRKGILKLHTYCTDDSLFFEVRDNGTGILPSDKDRIFTQFYTSKLEGSGLGLPITKKFIEHHDGSIHFTSVPNEGTIFIVRLPLSSN